VSCAGWDICAAFNMAMPEGSRFTIFRRRIADSESFDQGEIFPTSSAVEAALDVIRMALTRGQYSFKELFPNDTLINNPNYGAF
jgi:hypothetical protein